MKKKSVNKNRAISVLVCAMLFMSVVGLLISPMQAENIADDPADRDDFVQLLSTTSDTGAAGDHIDCYVGQQDVRFGLEVGSLLYGVGGDEKNVTRVHVEVDRNNALTEITWINQHEMPGAEGADMSAPAGNETFIFGVDSDVWYDAEPFEFNVDADAEPGEYRMDVRISYRYVDETNTGENAFLDTYIDFEIANNADVADVDATDSDNLWAGELFQEFSVNVANDGGELLDDASLTLSGLPTGVTLRDSTARIPDGIAVGDNEDFFYRVDVEWDVAPGIYPIDYTLEATRDGVDVTEIGEIDLVVDFTPKIQASITEEIIIEQGTITETIEVTFENVGNVPLNEVYIGLVPGGDYFPVAVDHYEYGDEVYPMHQYVGDMGIGGDTTLEFGTGFHRFIQEGTHMLQFRWDAWYYDDGATGEATRYYHVGVDWIDDNPDYGLLYDVVEDNHMYDEPAGDDEIFSPWIAPHIFMDVVDEVIDMEGFVDDSVELLGDITYIELEVTLQNFELVPFRDLEVILNVGEGTPFLNPVDRTLDTVAMHRGDSADSIGAYNLLTGNPGEADIVFYVSVNSEYVTDTLHGLNHAYLGSMVITSMINENTLEEVTDQTIPLSGEVRGFGPRVVVEGEFSDNRVIAGEVFDLNYTIANHGDDIARDTWITMQPNLYNNEDWRIHNGFIRAIASDAEMEVTFGEDFEGRMTNKSTRYTEVTLETLSIDSAKEIVDLHMYVEGALSSPQPYVWVLYVGEIAPGDEVTVTFEMVSDRDMQIGKPYQETIFIECIDTDGQEWEWEYPLTIRTREKGESYEPEAGMFGTGADAATMMMLLLVIILVIVVAIFVVSRKGGKHKAEKVPEATEPEFEPEPAPEPYEEPEPFEEPFEEPEEEWEVESEEPPAPPEFEEEVIEEPEEEEEVW